MADQDQSQITPTSRWNRSRPAVIVHIDAIAMVSLMVFCYWTGRLVMTIGVRLRRWLPAEFSHRAYLRTLRWMFWRPEGFAEEITHAR